MRSTLIVLPILAFFSVLSAQAATLVPNDPVGISVSGIYHDYSRIRFSSPTGETGGDASLFGETLRISFGGGSFGGITSGAGLDFDFASANIGLVIESDYPTTVLNDLLISASGTYSVVASPVVGSWAQVIAQIPFTLSVIGVNGIPYAAADLTRGYSLDVLPSQVTVAQNGTRVDSGAWTADWSISGLGSSLAEIFNLPTMKVTALDLAITPDLSALSMDGTSSLYLSQISFTPMPEPSSTALLACGSALLLSRRRRVNS